MGNGYSCGVLRAVLGRCVHLPRSRSNGTAIISPARAQDGWDWDQRWQKGNIPWDLGEPTPVVEHLIEIGSFPEGRVLVPGCGSGYDVVALANPNRYVVGLDISNCAIKKARERSANLQNASSFAFLSADFFTWNPNELFDCILDHKFFCAIDPSLRPDWAKKIKELLKPDGELITLICLISDQVGGPPYDTSVADYEEVLKPQGFEALSIEDNELAVESNKGREKLGRWKMRSTHSSL